MSDGFTVPDRARVDIGELDADVPGDLVQFDCFHVGSFKETRLGQQRTVPGQIWQYTAIDGRHDGTTGPADLRLHHEAGHRHGPLLD